jgi:hypothetical protein
MGMVVERNPNRPFLLKFELLKVAVLFAAKITWAWPKNKSDAAPYVSMDELDFSPQILLGQSKESHTGE